MKPWSCGNCGATVKEGVECPLCGSALCPSCDGERAAIYFDGDREVIGPCPECSGEGFIPMDWAEAA